MAECRPLPIPLFLTEEEALALLNLCLVSEMECEPSAERAITKPADLMRDYMAAAIVAERAAERTHESAHPPFGSHRAAVSESGPDDFIHSLADSRVSTHSRSGEERAPHTAPRYGRVAAAYDLDADFPATVQ